MERERECLHHDGYPGDIHFCAALGLLTLGALPLACRKRTKAS